MARFVGSVLLGVVLVGCKPSVEEECLSMVDTWDGCMGEAFGDDADALDEAEAQAAGYCDQFQDVEGDAADAAVDQIDCYRSAIEGGDCGSVDGYASITIDLATCQSPVDVPF